MTQTSVFINEYSIYAAFSLIKVINRQLKYITSREVILSFLRSTFSQSKVYRKRRWVSTMSLTDVMDDVDYERQNFTQNEALTQHPLWLTESHFVYHLQRNADGHLTFKRDFDGEPICSPR